MAYTWIARGEPRRAAGAGAGGRDAGQALAAGHRDHQGRDAAAVRHPAAGGAAGLAGAGARHPAAERARAAHPRAQARRPEPDRGQELPAGGDAAGGLDQRPAGAAGGVAGDAEALPGRCRAPAQDAAGGPAHAGRHGAAREDAGRATGACSLAAADVAARSVARPTPSTSCCRWRAAEDTAGHRCRASRVDLATSRPRWCAIPCRRAHGHSASTSATRAGPHAGCAAWRHARAGPPDPAAGAGAQPGRQRAPLHAEGRRRDGARRARPFGQVARCCRWRTPAPASPVRARAGVPALLPGAGQRRWTAPASGWPSWARLRSSTARTVVLDDARPPAQVPPGEGPGARFTIRFRVAPVDEPPGEVGEAGNPPAPSALHQSPSSA